ncbi:MAG: hypothetical protein PHC44_04175 [Lutispora sp.]|nr:hypothetical protein [Lutispora sp.]MDD4833916.1 hypothetical protein [Lutispora sp.]
MSKSDFKKTIKKAILLADTIEKAAKLSHAIDDILEGLEEIEKSLFPLKINNLIKEHLEADKGRRNTR